MTSKLAIVLVKVFQGPILTIGLSLTIINQSYTRNLVKNVKY